MYRKTTTIRNKSGLHARPASDFVRLAGQFSSAVHIRKVGEPDSQLTNAKSILFLIGKGYGPGCDIEICAEGSDETEAVDQLVALVDSGFGEPCDEAPAEDGV